MHLICCEIAHNVARSSHSFSSDQACCLILYLYDDVWSHIAALFQATFLPSRETDTRWSSETQNEIKHSASESHANLTLHSSVLYSMNAWCTVIN